MKSKSVILIDNFYEDAMAKRKEALSFDFRIEGSYAGLNSVQRTNLEEAIKKITSTLGTPLLEYHRCNTHGHYRLSKAFDIPKHDIHADSQMTGLPFPQWVGVCYLSLPEDCQGGTSFWRHNKTHLTKYPTPEEQLKVSRMADIPNIPLKIANYFIEEGRHRERWTEIRKIPMVFNRLVLFKADFFHTHSSTFGDKPENSRLIQAFCFNEVDYFIKRVLSYAR